MKHVLTKSSHKRHLLDGKDLESRSYLPHDLMHFAYAEVTGSREGFFSEGENLMREEAIVGVLQGGYKEWTAQGDAFDGENFVRLLNEYLVLSDHAPVEITSETLQKVFTTYKHFTNRWRDLPTGQSIIIEAA